MGQNMATASAGDAGKTKDARTRAIWQVLVFLLALVAAVITISTTVNLANKYQGAGLLGDSEKICVAGRFCRVTSVDAGSPMARAGVRAGDDILYDETFAFLRNPAAGEKLGATIRRGTT